jgi:hypothetical protein
MLTTMPTLNYLLQWQTMCRPHAVDRVLRYHVLHGSRGGLIRFRVHERKRPALFRGRLVGAEVIVLSVLLALPVPAQLRQPEENMAERNLRVNEVTIWGCYHPAGFVH